MAWWSVLAEQSVYPQFLAVAGMLALAGALLSIDFNHAANRAFALVLLFRAVIMLASMLHGVYTFSPPAELGGIGDPRGARFWAGIAPYFVIPMPFLILWFALVYPRRRTFLATRWWGPLLLCAVVLALELVYALDHAWYIGTETATFTHASGATWSATAYRADGPFAILLGLMYAGFAILALVFTIDYVRLPPGPRKHGMFAVVIGFLLNAIYDGSVIVVSLLSGFGLYSGGPVVMLAMAGLFPAVAAIILLDRHRRHTSDATVRRHAGRLLPLVALPMVSAIVAIHNPFSNLAFVQLLLTGFWRLWLPALVTYALVRHQLFDIDLKLKFALKQSTLAGLAFVGFVVMSETLEVIITSSRVLTEAVPEQWVDLASLGVAVGLTYALTPVKHFAGHVANRAMPNTQDTEDYLARKRLEVFRATLEGAVEDGDMTAREQLLVERLRVHLGLSDADIKPVIAEVQAAYAGRTIGTPNRPAAPQ